MEHSDLPLGVLAVWFGLTLLMSMFTLLDQLGETSGGVEAASPTPTEPPHPRAIPRRGHSRPGR